ncbi:hypothetical protein VII00023_00110 [Vibrio ichthyoenteri ATCC 700023]|uniref:Phosphatase n=1 Tax=Vibrio ichthyoenteri ATCC 700023 TaxID=870968 RepID=F9S1C6_9VIBR|nr:HAD-IA family hydrolase [Vibrio ichthyoenteri]EGU41965.1 hypothetical protein VII00023_00110 [Vibrio ichthyoenteri ATCC 700023]
MSSDYVMPFDAKRIRAIVFDLDNTLVSSTMDFNWLRSKVGCPQHLDLLSYTNNIDCPQQRAVAQQHILDHEIEDAQLSYSMPGCEALLAYIEDQDLHTAIITRNCLQAAQLKVTHNQLGISRIISREHYPPKPSPVSLVALANEWQLNSAELLYVGDHLYDLEAAANAKMPSCLVTHGQNSPFTASASVVVEQLNDLLPLLERR